MAQSRIIAIVTKIEKIENDIMEMQKILTMLLKVMSVMKKKQLGKKSDLAKNLIGRDNINALLQSGHQSDNLILKIQNLLNHCSSNSMFVQRQLELRSYQSNLQ